MDDIQDNLHIIRVIAIAWQSLDCQVDFDVDNVQPREVVNVYGVQRYVRVIIIIISLFISPMKFPRLPTERHLRLEPERHDVWCTKWRPGQSPQPPGNP